MFKLFFLSSILLAQVQFVEARENQSEVHPFYFKAPNCQSYNTHHEFVLCLNRYAEQVLKDESFNGIKNPIREQLLADLNSAQISLSDSQTSLEIFRISIDPLSKKCFDFSELDENERTEVSEKMADQIKEAALFLKTFHFLTLGAKRGLFQIDQVQICSEEGLGRSLQYEGGILKLGLNEDYESFDLESIKNDWNDRKHLKVNSTFIDLQKWMDQRLSRIIGFALSSSQAIREIEQDKLWHIINPIGQIRTEARRSIRYVTTKGVDLLKKRIQEFKKNLKATPDLTIEKAQDLVAQKQKSILIDKIQSDLVKQKLVEHNLADKIQQLDLTKTEQLYNRWLEKSQDVHLAESVISNAQEAVYDQNVDIKVTRTGESWIKVTNWHVILASMNLNSGSSVEPAIEGFIKRQAQDLPSIRITHEDHSNATIHVDTFDYITATFSATSSRAVKISEKIMPTVALFEALKELGFLSNETLAQKP